MQARILNLIHIPKTAGTSLRKAMESQEGQGTGLLDYGPESPTTSKTIRQLIYKHNDFFRLYQYIHEHDIRFISGHNRSRKYLRIAGIRNSFLFLRDPVERVVSEYHHFVDNYGYDKSFDCFFRAPQFINRQSHFLAKIPLGLIGVVGLTERYAESVQLINETYDMKLPELRENVRKNRAVEKLSSSDRQEIVQLNKTDARIYQQASALLDARLNSQNEHVFHSLKLASDGLLSGCAWYARSDEPVNLDVYIDNNLTATITANSLAGGVLTFGPPRHGYVGIRKRVELKAGQTVRCHVSDSGQELALEQPRENHDRNMGGQEP